MWRVLKAADAEIAEPAFRHYVEQAMRLAQAELSCAHLEAQNEHFLRLIADSEAQVERVREDLQLGDPQDQDVARKQQEVKKDVAICWRRARRHRRRSSRNCSGSCTSSMRPMAMPCRIFRSDAEEIV